MLNVEGVYCTDGSTIESTLRRHGYYCRSRRAGSTTRRPSCISCAKGKARCDHRRPQCSRCLGKGIDCLYPKRAPRGVVSMMDEGDDLSMSIGSEIFPVSVNVPSTNFNVESINEGNIDGDNDLVVSDPDFENILSKDVDWIDPDLDFSTLLDPQTTIDTTQHHLSTPPSLTLQIPTSPYQTSQRPCPLTPPPSLLTFLPPQQPSYTFHTMIQRPSLLPSRQRTATLILHTLKSYPVMMQRHNALPPFIHSSMVESNTGNDERGRKDDMSALNDCRALVHMLGSGVQGSRKLFWKNVRRECERLYENVSINFTL